MKVTPREVSVVFVMCSSLSDQGWCPVRVKYMVLIFVLKCIWDFSNLISLGIWFHTRGAIIAKSLSATLSLVGAV